MVNKTENYLKNKLNEQQFEAASYVTWHSLILAWAGSGKTRTLTYKIANLIYGHQVDKNSILAVTFTNKAAAEMKERLSEIMKDMKNNNKWESAHVSSQQSSEEDAWFAPDEYFQEESTPTRMKQDEYKRIWTFHGIFLKILKEDIDKLWRNRKKNFVIYDANDSQSLTKSIIKKKEYTDIVEHKDAKRTISGWKNKWYTPEQAWLHCDGRSDERILEIYQEYWKQCQESNAVDFDDLLLLPKLLLDLDKNVLTKWQNQFQHILVDEAQDTNTLQFDLMKLLSWWSKSKTITFIGDDYQSIYRWRWAMMSNFLNLEKLRPEIKMFKLEINYRSLPHIVQAWNAIIKQNKVQYDKNVSAHRTWEKHIRVFEFADEKDEALHTIDMIKKLKEESNKNWADFTILYRTNAQSVPFEHVCMNDTIPYKVVGWRKFFERKEVKDILSYLKFLLNPDDSLTLKRIINVPWRWIGKTTIEACEQLWIKNNISLCKVILNCDAYQQDLKPAALKKLISFKNMIAELTASLAMQTPSQTLDQLSKWLKYEARLVKQDGKDKAEERMWNIGQLINMAMKYTNPWVESHNEFLEETSLLTSIEETKTEEADAIKMMSVHGSKWLEFPYVFIVWLEENIFPLPKAKFDTEELEEERRGMYVAITRAQDHLFMSYANSRMQRGQLKYNPASRFIDELPDNITKRYSMTWASSLQQSVPKVDLDEWERVAHKLFWPWTVLEVRDTICIVKFDNPKFNVRKLEGKWLQKK